MRSVRDCILALPIAAMACTSAPVEPQHPLDVRVPFAPAPVSVSDATRLVYEVHVTNTGEQPLRLTRLTVEDPQNARAIADLSGDALARTTVHLEPPPDDAASPPTPVMVTTAAGDDPLALAPGTRAILYLEIDVDSSDGLDSLVHRIEYAREDVRLSAEQAPDTRTDTTATGETAAVAVRDDSLPVLGPPVAGGPWVAVYHPSWPRGHRRVLYRVGGRERIPGRFAIDWIRVDPDGHTVRGDTDIVADWIGHRAEVLAVADAQVVATRDDVAESKRISTHPDHPLEDATGNYVALDLGNGHYAFYEHLAPGSIRVAPGDRVRRGQPIAALGFTGHSTSPHLHFHVASANSALGAEGLPFVLECFEVLGRYESLDALGSAPWTPLDPGARRVRRREMPAPNVVLDPACSSSATPAP